MRWLLLASIIVVNSSSAMDDFSEKDYMPVHIKNLKGIISVVGDVDSPIILESIKDYLEENSLQFKDLWYEDGKKMLHFALEIVKVADHGFIKMFVEAFPEMLFIEFLNGKGYITIDNILVAKWKNSKPKSEEKRQWQLLVNDLRQIHKLNSHIEVIKAPFTSRSIRPKNVQSKPSIDMPASELIFSDNPRSPLQSFLNLIRSETESIFMVFSDFESIEVAHALGRAQEKGVEIELIVNPIDSTSSSLEKLSQVDIGVGTYPFEKLKRPNATNFALFKSQKVYIHGSWYPEDESENNTLALMGIHYDKEGFSKLEDLYRIYFDYSDPKPSGSFFKF